MKPTDVLRIAEPIEKMYMDCVSQLIINLSGHFDVNDVTPTAEWGKKKLSELGALTNESIEIIAANTGQKAADIRKAVTEGLGLEIKDTEKVLQGAANKGLIQGASQSWEASESVKTVVKNLTEQANSDLNIVNTTMLQSTREQYVWAVQNTANAEMVFAQAQQAMNTAAMTVATGVEARTQALRRTIKQLADNGITGFVDRAGHKWSPEAYVNMNIRTTVHNAAVQGQKARSADYGVDTFQISSHSGARPLCAPYQGKFYSWTETGGVVEDLYGNKYKFENINVTSYGEPAGIFGINCGHSPQTFVSGYNIPRYEPTEDFEKNAEEYALSQKQRYYERQIRDAKTEALAYDAAGDKEAFQRKAVQIKEKNARYKAFCEENNLTPKLDRTQVMAYNRSVAGKANAAVRYYNPQNAKTVQAISGARITNRYGKPAEAHADRYYGLVRSMKTDVQAIAKNTGYDVDTIRQIKNFVFMDEHDLGNGQTERFSSDFAMAQSWQRLITGTQEPHDMILLQHEMRERQLMMDGLTQHDAHIIASREFNYDKEADKFYGALKTNKNKK